jgi:hypothetical protein
VIIKVVKRKPGERSRFGQLGRYILNAKRNDPVLFTRTAEYVMDLNGEGEKVAWYRITNCQSDTPAVAIAEVLTTQAENHRTKSDKTYHLVVSLPHWERLTREQAADIEDTICAGLGFSEHQRVSAVHQDTDHSHLHIAINKIHPTNFRCIEPYYPYYKLDTLAKELEIKYGLYQANRIGQGKRFASAGDVEAHQQEESFLRWLHENLGDQLKEVLKDGQGWQAIHELLATHGAIIKPRGAGLAIVTMDGKVGIKASSFDRKLSLKSLTDRFGAYEPPILQEKRGKQYRPDARKQAETSTLYAEYQTMRQANYETRTKALNELRTERNEFRFELKDRYGQRRASVKANTQMDNRTKRSAYHELSQQRNRELAEFKQREEVRKRAVREGSPAMTWDEYLANRAEHGNAEALTILRRRKNYRQEISQALLTVENFEDARDIIKLHFKPTVLKNGKVIYRAQDGGVVFDDATAISVKEVTEAATLLALSLADERFHGKALVVEGSDEFKLQVARLSALEGLSVRLADPVLEKDRQRHVRAKELSQQGRKETIQEQQKQPERNSGRDCDQR